MAARLAEAVGEIDGVEITQPVEANGVFARLPRPAIDRLLAELPGEHPFYIWDDAANEVRWMCSWDTTAEDVDEFRGGGAASGSGLALTQTGEPREGDIAGFGLTNQRISCRRSSML